MGDTDKLLETPGGLTMTPLAGRVRKASDIRADLLLYLLMLISAEAVQSHQRSGHRELPREREVEKPTGC